MQPRMILLLALIVTVALYWAGLSGPFILDDAWNLEPLRRWHMGQASLQEVLFPQGSLIFSRPLAMGSFVLTTWLFGPDTFSFKLGNLIVHLACGVLGWAVLRRALARDPRLAVHAEWLAALAAALWLLHPLHVSTVLYVVQRMAQLSTLFTLAAVLVYLIARLQIVEGRTRPAWLNLFIVFPVLVGLGVLSKQNAAVAPALCLVFELAYFTKQTRPGRYVPAFFGIFLAAPVLAAIALLVSAPAILLGGYTEWDFTLWERLLTQPRVLLDYIGMLLIPRGPLMGLYTDDFIVSRGLLSPISTLFSMLALLGISAAAIVMRKRAPSVFAGWFFFLVAHSVESTFLPLEMYYEHRNYLPSLGLFLAMVGLVALVPNFHTNVISPRKLGMLAATGFTLVLCVATLGRVLIWQDMDGITQQALKHHPESARLRLDIAAKALERKDFDGALAAMNYLAESNDPRHRQRGNLSIYTIKCLRKDAVIDLGSLRKAASENLPRVTTYEAQSFMRLSRTTNVSGCGNVGVEVIADYLRQIIDSANSQPDSSQPKWYSRAVIAEMYLRTDRWEDAKQQGELAWNASHDQKAGALLAAIYLYGDRLQPAERMLATLSKSVKPYDLGGQKALADLQALLARKRSGLQQDGLSPPGSG